MLRRIDLQSVDELAREILDLSRERPIVGVTNRPPASQPLIDVSSLAARVADVADVCVIATGDATWRLAELLPAKLDVYGGAARTEVATTAKLEPGTVSRWRSATWSTTERS